MGVEPRLDTTNAEASTTALSETGTKLKPPAPPGSSSSVRWGHILTGVCAILSAIVTATNSELIKNIEYQSQTLFFELRGPVAPPDNIVILAIDDESLLIPKQLYQIDPKKYSYLEPLQAFPWKRKAYAEAIDKLMQAGAKSVALDLELPDKSSYGSADDRRLRQTLQRYAGRVTLAAAYEEMVTPLGLQPQLSEPYQLFWTEPMSIGAINYPVEADGKVHRFTSEFRNILAEKYKQQLKQFDSLKLKAPAFDFHEATLQAAQVKYPQPKGEYIYFYGPQGTFKQIPFWHVIEPESWKQQSKYFKDKIVLIGATASTLKDFHLTPFSQTWRYPQPLSGVEIHASAIATLLQGKAIAQAMPNTISQGILVLMIVAASGGILSRQKGYFNKLGWTIGIVIAWGSISYITFVYGQRILPTAVPIVAIALSGVYYLTTEATNQKIRKLRLRNTLSQYPTSPIVQDIIRQQDDLQDLLSKQDAESSTKIIGGRYEIIKVLGAGGFGETYIAQDTQRPGKPICVVKQLKPDLGNPKHLELARRLFPREAEALEKLGKHEQIPQLLAYFEEREQFYLVQEFIDGHSLEDELLPNKPLSETEVIDILQQLLSVLEFVHSHSVIHRDIKPNNIIRRHSDNKLVLIDFGAVKEISTQLLSTEGSTRFTVAIGTQGYAPHEQCAGRPRPNSDIYALGVTAIRALTGLPPNQLLQDVRTGDILWTHKAQVSPELAEIVSKMVRYDLNQRYQSASEVREDLLGLTNFSSSSLSSADPSINFTSSEELDAPTEYWSSESNTLFPSESE